MRHQDGLYIVSVLPRSPIPYDILRQIRGEFMRASRILSARPDRTIISLAQLCEERELSLPDPSHLSRLFRHG